MLIAEIKKQLFVSAISQLLCGRITGTPEDILQQLTTVSTGQETRNAALAHAAAGLANEFTEVRQCMDVAYKVLLNITNNLHPKWNRAHLFAAENRLLAGDYSKAKHHLQQVLHNIFDKQLVDTVVQSIDVSAGKEYLLDFAQKSKSPPLARKVLVLWHSIELQIESPGDDIIARCLTRGSLNQRNYLKE